jgi:hypothetical protein
MKKTLSIIILYVFCSANANAIARLGAFDCGTILKYKEIKDSQESVEDWLNGFLTAAQLARKPLKEGNIPSSNGRYFWVIKFCEENPLSDITEAAAQLYLEITK